MTMIGRLANTRPWLWRQIESKVWLQKQRAQANCCAELCPQTGQQRNRAADVLVLHAQDLSNRGNGMASASGTWRR